MYEMAKKENTQSCFQRGLISLLILALLDQEDMYGYQIVQEITERSGGAIIWIMGAAARRGSDIAESLRPQLPSL